VKFDAKILSNHVYKYAQRIDNKVVSAAKLTEQSQEAAKNLIKKTTKLGNKLGYLGGVVTATDIFVNSELKTSHTISIVMTAISFTGVGAIVTGVWFVADVGTGLITGTSISDRIDSAVGAPLVDWEY